MGMRSEMRINPARQEITQNVSALSVKVETRDEQIIQVLSDKHCRVILSLIKETTMTASEICLASNIPRTTVYKKLKLLRELKILNVSYDMKDDGKKRLSFQNKIARVDIMLYDKHLGLHTNFMLPEL